MKNLIVLMLPLFVMLTPARGSSAGEYVLDADASEFVVRLYKAGIGAALAHNHVIEATDVQGAVTWDPQAPADASVSVQADARSLVADADPLREKYDLEKTLADDKRSKVQSTMESDEQMDVERYPEMSFESTRVTPVEDGSVEITGDLTLHGQTRQVSFRTTPEVEGETLRADAEIELLQSDFGIEPYSSFLGAVKNEDRAKMVIHLIATRSHEDTPETTKGEVPSGATPEDAE